MAELGVAPERFKAMAFGRHHEQEHPVDQIISSLVNSGADLDKMSYLYLDGYFTGVTYGAGIDFPGLLKAATVGPAPGTGKFHLAYTDRGIQSVENLMMTRYWNFRSLYWHHTNRAIMAMILNVVRDVYSQKRIDPIDYIAGTLWSTDIEALRYLDRRYHDLYSKSSILNGLLQDRKQLYRRLYTVRSMSNDEIDKDIYEKLDKISNSKEKERALRKKIAESTGDYLRSMGKTTVANITIDDVLIDVPRRKMDSGGNVFIYSNEFGGLRRIEEISKPVEAISKNYEELTKRARVFVSPRIAKLLGDEIRGRRREGIQKLLTDAINDVMPSGQTK